MGEEDVACPPLTITLSFMTTNSWMSWPSMSRSGFAPPPASPQHQLQTDKKKSVGVISERRKTPTAAESLESERPLALALMRALVRLPCSTLAGHAFSHEQRAILRIVGEGGRSEGGKRDFASSFSSAVAAVSRLFRNLSLACIRARARYNDSVSSSTALSATV